MLVDIDDLRVTFPGPVEAVRGVSLTIGAERLGIVGESGSGKSLTARALMRLLPSSAQLSARRLSFDGIDLLTASPRALRQVRGRRAGMILQDPKHALNPVMTTGQQVAEAWRLHKGGSRRDAAAAAIDLLARTRIRDPGAVAARYPHALSGGMAQRVMIAMMLAGDPELLIADEPTSALDATVQAEILKLIDALIIERGMGLLLISHDLKLVASFCDRVLVMRHGEIVESLAADALTRAEHPYTRGLLACVPSLRTPRARLPELPRQLAVEAGAT